MFGLIGSYAIIYIPMWLLSGFTAQFNTNVGLWGEFFRTEERIKRDRLHREELRGNMNLIDKIFLALFRLIKNW